MRTAYLIGLMLAAAPAAVAAPSAPPIVKDGVEITILPSNGAAAGPAGVSQVSLDLEVKTDEAAHRLGFRSMRGVTEVDCHQAANRFVKADSFDQPGLKGVSRPRLVTGNWVHPNPDSYMFAVTQRICGAAAPGPPSLTPTAASHAAPSHAGPPAAASAPAAPLPIVTAMALPPPAPAPAQTAAAPQPPPPPPQAAPPEWVAMTTSPAWAHAAAPTPARPKPTAAPSSPAWSAKPDGRGVAQVAAVASAKDAQRVLNQLHSLITPPLTQTVEAAVVQNASIYRASVVGFASLADAKAFCARAASVSKTCWVHWKAPPTKPS